MRARKAILAVALSATLSACTGDDSDSRASDELTEITIECDQFADTAEKITDAQSALYSGTGGTEAIDTLIAELDALKDGAPADVQTALANMGAAFRDAQEILEGQTQNEQKTRKERKKLARLASELSDDGQKITAYITSQCG